MPLYGRFGPQFSVAERAHLAPSAVAVALTHRGGSTVRSWFPGRKTTRAWRGAPVLVLVFFCGHAPCGGAEIYRCSTPDGGTAFSDKVCGADAVVVQGKTTVRAPDVRAVAPAPQAATITPRSAARASTVPASGSLQSARPAHASAPAQPRAAAQSRAPTGDDKSELENLAYLRAMGEQCPLPVEHTYVLRFLDTLAADRLASQGIRLTPEDGQRRAARARERARLDAAAAKQNACADADRRLVALGQTRVHFEVISKSVKPEAAQAPSLHGAAPSGG
jgi:hypothetical protein